MDPSDYLLLSEKYSNSRIEVDFGGKDDSVWLILDNKSILRKSRSFVNGNIVWEYRFRGVLNCPFKLETENESDIIRMCNPSMHSCDVDPTEIIVHKFKLEVKETIYKKSY